VFWWWTILPPATMPVEESTTPATANLPTTIHSFKQYTSFCIKFLRNPKHFPSTIVCFSRMLCNSPWCSLIGTYSSRTKLSDRLFTCPTCLIKTCLMFLKAPAESSVSCRAKNSFRWIPQLTTSRNVKYQLSHKACHRQRYPLRLG